MAENQRETTKKQHLTTAKDEHHDREPSENMPPSQAAQGPFISTPLYISSGAATPGPFEQQQQQFEGVNPKRPRYTPAGQWKLLPSPSQQHHQQQQSQMSRESTPSPSTHPQPQPHATAAASSSDTAPSPSPSHSPRPSQSAASGQETSKPSEGEKFHQQFRKGKYVSPVWKPNEMLWLARAWRVQYQSGPDHGSGFSAQEGTPSEMPAASGRGKTRADKDREVAEFLNRHGVNRDAKTAGTKWDNMLGEFRKVYEWERGGEREHVGKSYFRLSPYERKIHRLPASFDEEVFEELCQFMGPRMRSSHHHSRGASAAIITAGDDQTRMALAAAKSLPPPPPFKEDELPLSARTRQLVMSGGSEGFKLVARAAEASPLEVGVPSSSSSKELRRIGKMRMIWEESVSLWAEEGEYHRGRVKLQGSSFLNADELAFLDDSLVACAMESFEDGLLKGFSVDRFLTGQQVKVFGRRKSSSVPATHGGFKTSERVQPPPELSIRSAIIPWEFQDPTEHYMGCLRVPPATFPSLFELPWHLQEPPPEEFRFPLRKDVYRDLPQGKELFFTTSNELLDCKTITYDFLTPIMRSNPSLSGATATSRDAFIGLWDDCINRIISRFCSIEMVFVRKSSSSSLSESIQDQWPHLTAFLRNFCLWRGEETDQIREGQIDPSSSIVEKLLWTYMDLPYILGYYAVGYIVTFCALSRSQNRIIRTDLYTVDLSMPTERVKALVPCWRIAGLLPLLAEKCFNYMNTGSNLKFYPFSDFESIDLGNGNLIEITPNTVNRFFSSKRRWAAVKEIYDFLGQRIPHAEYIVKSAEKDLALVFKPRVCKFMPANCDQLIEALKHVTKALVVLHDLSFMHRDLRWEKVMRTTSDGDNEWVVTGFDEATSAPQIMQPREGDGGAGSGTHAPEMSRGLHGVKVDVWGVGQLIKTCGLVGVPKLLRELQNKCLDHNPEQRPTAADCYRHLLQLQSSISAAAAGGY